jgi:hypothetical protein
MRNSAPKQSAVVEKLLNTAATHELDAIAAQDRSRAKYLNAMAKSFRGLANAIEPDEEANAIRELLSQE